MPSARRVPEAEALAELDDRQAVGDRDARSRTTLISGSDDLADGAAVSLPAASCARRRGRPAVAPRAPPFETRDAGDEQHTGHQENEAQLVHAFDA